MEAFVLQRELLDKMLAVIDLFITDHAQRAQPCPCATCAEACLVYKEATAAVIGRGYD